MGGQSSLRSYWRNYFESTDGVVWVVDSGDRQRLQLCAKELRALLREEVRMWGLWGSEVMGLRGWGVVAAYGVMGLWEHGVMGVRGVMGVMGFGVMGLWSGYGVLGGV